MSNKTIEECLKNSEFNKIKELKNTEKIREDLFQASKLINFFDYLPSLTDIILDTSRFGEKRACGAAIMLVDHNGLFSSFTPEKKHSIKDKYLVRQTIAYNKKGFKESSRIQSRFNIETLIKRAEGKSSFKRILSRQPFERYFDPQYLDFIITHNLINENSVRIEQENFEKRRNDAEFIARYPDFATYYHKLTLPLRKGKKIYGVLTLDSFENVNQTKSIGREYIEYLQRNADTFTKYISEFFDQINPYLKELNDTINKTRNKLSEFEKPPYTFEHSKRTALLCTEYMRYLNRNKITKFESKDFFSAYIGAMLHDIGKLDVDPKILNLKRELTYAEFNEIKKHPERGYEKLKKASFPESTLQMVKYHHAYLDHTGYPKYEGELSMLVRILTITDIFDALTNKRPYKEKWPLDNAIAMLYDYANNNKLDMKLVRNFEGFINSLSQKNQKENSAPDNEKRVYKILKNTNYN